MIIHVNITFHAKEELSIEAKAFLITAIKQAALIKGNLQVGLSQCHDKPEVFHVFSKWKSKEHFEKYISMREETGFFDDVAMLFKEAPAKIISNSIPA